MTSPNPIAAAAAPALIAALEAIQQFAVNIGPDPQAWPLKVPGAFNVLLGSIEMQLPALGQGEAEALQSAVNVRIQALITQLKAMHS